MTTDEILHKEREIWGDKKQTLEHIAVCLAKDLGDLSKEARAKIETGQFNEQELKKEMGNVIASMIRWIDDLGYDVNECLKLALEAQAKYPKT